MDKQLYQKVTGGKITANFFVIWMLSFCSNFGMTKLFDLVYFRFTVEGRRWLAFKSNANGISNSLRGFISGDSALMALGLQISHSVNDRSKERMWWALLDLFEDYQLVKIYHEFLEGARPRHFALFNKACQDIFEYSMTSAKVNSAGVIETVVSKDTLRMVAIQHLTEALTVSAHHGLSEFQVKHRLLEIVKE